MVQLLVNSISSSISCPKHPIPLRFVYMIKPLCMFTFILSFFQKEKEKKESMKVTAWMEKEVVVLSLLWLLMRLTLQTKINSMSNHWFRERLFKGVCVVSCRGVLLWATDANRRTTTASTGFQPQDLHQIWIPQRKFLICMNTEARIRVEENNNQVLIWESHLSLSLILVLYIYTERKRFLLLLYVNYIYIYASINLFYLFPSFTFMNRRWTHIQARKRMVHGFDLWQ